MELLGKGHGEFRGFSPQVQEEKGRVRVFLQTAFLLQHRKHFIMLYILKIINNINSKLGLAPPQDAFLLFWTKVGARSAFIKPQTEAIDEVLCTAKELKNFS